MIAQRLTECNCLLSLVFSGAIPWCYNGTKKLPRENLRKEGVFLLHEEDEYKARHLPYGGCLFMRFFYFVFQSLTSPITAALK